MNYFFTPILLIAVAVHLHAQDAAAYIQAGNRYYRQGQYMAAAAEFDKAITGPYPSIALFNKANALYRGQQLNEAIRIYEQLAGSKATTRMERAAAYYNAGVAYSAQQKLPESIAAYKNALRQNPQDAAARDNLQKALMELQRDSGSHSTVPKKATLTPAQAQQELQKLQDKEKQTARKLSSQKTQYNGSNGKDW